MLEGERNAMRSRARTVGPSAAPFPPCATPLDRGAAVESWFARRGWTIFPFQRQTWGLMGEGQSGLLHATTGSGKTLAVAFGAWLATPEIADADEGFRVLWITPMRALAADTERSLREAFADVAPQDGASLWRVGARTGDTSGSQRAALTRKPPRLLVTTPESLTLMLTQERARETFASLAFVVVDEWHELIGNKRGVQTELALARLRHFCPGVATWGLSATLGNLKEAKRVLLGPLEAARGALVEGRLDKPLVIDTLLPKSPERFPWAGHLGAKMVDPVVAEIEAAKTTLVFTNTRSQAELWYQHILRRRPEWAGILAIHHGSLSRETRDWVEQGLKEGSLKAVVSTSSLDLGVDFLPVERVIQIGSPKGVARLLQRAGRSGHAPGRVSRITLVPTHTLELVEAAAVRDAVSRKKIESRRSLNAPLDVLAQHCVTVALGGGFRPDDLLAEVRETAAYEHLSDENWTWVHDFIRRGGPSLTAYPGFRRVVPDVKGVWRAADRHVALQHKLNIGAIVSDASVMVQYGPAPRGAKLGTVEESFVARMKAGDKFWFAGRSLEFVRLRDQTAFVRATTGGGVTPRWQGGRMPLSTTLADAMLDAFVRARHDDYAEPELAAARPLIELQHKWSALPTPTSLLAETLKSREGWHLFLYPFAGRDIHLGLTSLLAWRAARERQGVFSLSVNDYGFEILSANARDWAAILPSLIAPAVTIDALTEEVIASFNAGELARRRFRDIAHIAGLVSRGFPGARRKTSVMQASSGLFYDVFRKYDPANGLLKQAEREVLEDELDVRRIQETLRKMSAQSLQVQTLNRATPFAFPLMVERLRERLSNETLSARIDRMVAQLEKAADS
jgi:ATP-dependent helicase Lhr and Lhr-like helicase